MRWLSGHLQKRLEGNCSIHFIRNPHVLLASELESKLNVPFGGLEQNRARLEMLSVMVY